jgi:hypothetical protein
MDDSKSRYPGPPKHAFVEAYGDPGLHVEKGAASAAFIVAAVVVDDCDFGTVREAADAIR